MPNVALKLCHDIVEPVLKRSPNSRVKSTNRFSNSPSALRKNVTPTKFVHMDRKASSKTKTLHADGVTIIKSKTSILKSLAETAVNTVVTGPLRCDNNCVTLVRKRDNYRGSCKCGTKRPKAKCSAKSIQTLLHKDYSRMDKACTHCIQTATCGTQFMEKYSMPIKRKTKSRSNTKIPGSARIESSLDRCLNVQRDSCNHRDDKAFGYRFVTAKPWALSNYPIRGPDF